MKLPPPATKADKETAREVLGSKNMPSQEPISTTYNFIQPANSELNTAVMRIVSTLSDTRWKTQFELYTDQLDKLIHSNEIANRDYLKSFGIKASKCLLLTKFESLVETKPNE